jgi:hypothetical protein
MWGLPHINSVIAVQGKRTDYTSPYDCAECYTNCQFDGENPFWFRKTEQGNIEAAGYLYEVSWTVGHPYTEDTDQPGLEPNGSILYRVKLVGQPCTSENLPAERYFNVSLKGDEQLRTLEPGQTDHHYYAQYDKGHYSSVCIEFIRWKYDGANLEFPPNCKPTDSGNGKIIVKNLEWPSDLAITPLE